MACGRKGCNMTLRVARGLFRLWLVLSVLWIGGVVIQTWSKPPVYDFDWVLPSELPSIEEAKRRRSKSLLIPISFCEKRETNSAMRLSKLFGSPVL
jgi:hypothetical protein